MMHHKVKITNKSEFKRHKGVNEGAFLQDGVVDFREYVMAISMLIEGSAVEKLHWSFKLYDKDRDGAITKEEMLEIMQVCVCALLCHTQTLSKAKVRSTFQTTAYLWDDITDGASFSPTGVCFRSFTGCL